MKRISESSIIICSIVRNAEKGLRRNIPVINELCRHFRDYRIVVYENDSMDGTKTSLKEWMEKDPSHVTVLLNNTDSSKTIPSAHSVTVNPFFSRKRISKMANIRNHYLDYVEENNLAADYLMVVDLDVAQLFAESILSSFSAESPEWDAVSAFGYSTSPSLKKRYHDTYALVGYGKENVPQTEKSIHDAALDMAKKMKEGKWLRVFSAFGGLAIYRFDSIKGLKYQVLDNDDIRVEVRCEHYSLYRQMAERGFDKVFINPQMRLKYQDLTIKIIWNSIVRKLRKQFGGGNDEVIILSLCGKQDVECFNILNAA